MFFFRDINATKLWCYGVPQCRQSVRVHCRCEIVETATTTSTNPFQLYDNVWISSVGRSRPRKTINFILHVYTNTRGEWAWPQWYEKLIDWNLCPNKYTKWLMLNGSIQLLINQFCVYFYILNHMKCELRRNRNRFVDQKLHVQLILIWASVTRVFM